MGDNIKATNTPDKDKDFSWHQNWTHAPAYAWKALYHRTSAPDLELLINYIICFHVLDTTASQLEDFISKLYTTRVLYWNSIYSII